MFFFTEKNLSVAKEDKLLNISRLQDFPIPCHITHQSSSESEFQVTWFWQKGTETEKRPLFTAYRNATLQDWVGKGDQLRFGHALQNRFSLTFLKPSPEDGGLYFCEVEEWLPSLSHGWRKHAVENSGYLTLHVYAEGKCIWMGCSKSQCLKMLLNSAYESILCHLHCRRCQSRLWATMPGNYLDGGFYSCPHLLTFGHIPTTVGDLQKQSPGKTEAGSKSVGRGAPTARKTHCRWLNLETRGGAERRRIFCMCHVIYSFLILFYKLL